MDLKAVAAQRLQVAATILFHSTCAISVTLVSKSALNGIDAPVTLLIMQTSVQVLLLTIIGGLTGKVKVIKPLQTWREFVPLALARTVGIIAKTFCLAAVDASFYQIARGLLLPFTLILSALFLGKSFSSFPPLSLVGCGSVIFGFGIGMFTDLNKMLTSHKGLALGVGSSLTTAIESVTVKKFVGSKAKDQGENMFQMVWMSSIISLGFYAPILLVSGEWKGPAIQALLGYAPIESSSNPINLHLFLRTCLLTGVFSFLLNIATFLQISVTSPTTHMIVTAARGVAQSAFAVVFLPHETMNSGRIWSMACILGGSALYGWAEDQAMTKKKQGYAQLAQAEEGGEKLGDVAEMKELSGKGVV